MISVHHTYPDTPRPRNKVRPGSSSNGQNTSEYYLVMFCVFFLVILDFCPALPLNL